MAVALYTVLVTGSRTWTDADEIGRQLNRIASQLPRCTDIRLVHGGAKGADTLAGEHARSHLWQVKRYAPDWHKHGRRAGIILNAYMLEVSKPDIVVGVSQGQVARDNRHDRTRKESGHRDGGIREGLTFFPSLSL